MQMEPEEAEAGLVWLVLSAFHARLARDISAPVAQLAEQLTLNQ